MSPKLAEYIEAGRALDADERLEAAHQLLLSVESDPGVSSADLDAAWAQVVGRRSKEILAGEAHLVDGQEAHAQVRAEIAALRK